MKKKMLTFGLIGLVSIGTTVGAFAATSNQGTSNNKNTTAVEQDKDKEVNDDVSIINANVKLTEAQAAIIALSTADANAKIIKIELQDENGTFAYGVDMVSNNNKVEVNVDANTGALLKNAVDNDAEQNDSQEVADTEENDTQSDIAILKANVKLTEAEASKLALNSVDASAKIVKVELQDENGTFAYGVDMILNNKIVEVNVDANSGTISASDNDQNDNNNDQETNDDGNGNDQEIAD